MAEPEYPVLRELETKLKLRWVDTDDIMATQRAIIQVEPELAYLELPRGRKGDKGDAGPAISIQGIITADSQLPASAEVGHAYVNTSTKGLAVWNGSSWFKVDNFAGVDADVQQFSRWLAQLESEARRAADAASLATDSASSAKYWANETIQQVTGDFATRNYVDALDPKIDRGTGEVWLTLADVDRIETIEPGFYTIRQGAGIALGMPVEGTGQLSRTWLNPDGTSQIDLYHLLVDGKFQSWSRRKTSTGWQEWERDAGEVIAEEIKAGYDPIERGTGEKWLIANDASRMDTLKPGAYSVVTGAAVYLDMPTKERGALRRFWLNTSGSAKLDIYFAEIDGQLHIWSRTFFAGAWQGWNKHGGTITGLDDTDVLHAITDNEGHVLQSFRRDGTVLIPGLTGNSMGTGYQFIDGNLTPTDTDMTHMVGWGSSTMNWLSYELSKIAKTIGAEYHNQGKGGEIGDATAARLGSRPALVTFPNNQIPSTAGTEVQVTISNVEAHGNPAPFAVTIEGVEGTLEMRVNKWYFTKLRTGPAVSLDGPVPAIPTEGRRLQGVFTVLNMGKNSFNRDIPNMVEYVTGLSIEAFDYLSPISKRALVLGHFVNAPDLPGSVRQQNVLDVNSRLKSHFGILYVDMQGMLESSRLWELTGISPSSDDLAAQANRVLPPSVRMDDQHLNDAGLAAVAALVREKMIELNWI